MKCKIPATIIIIIFCIFYISLKAFASDKTIYIKHFAKSEGFSSTDPIGERLKDYISEVIISKKGYTLTSDEEVRQVMSQEELSMSLDTCYDDTCVKKLMESIRTDYIIYGTVSLEEGRYYITAKMLDRTSGTIKLARVKSLQFKNKNKMKMAATDLANYLMDGKDIEMRHYDDEYQAVIESYGEKVPTGLAFYFLYFIPSDSPFSDYYDSLMGGGIDYYYKFNSYLSAGPGVYYIFSENESGEVKVSLNSYSVNARLGYPINRFLYPYIGLSGRVTWFNEKGLGNNINYTGYGGDGFAGLAFIIGKRLSAFADFSISIVKLNDNNKTDIGGQAIRGGVLISF